MRGDVWQVKNKPIYVELQIDAEMDRLWDATQTPEKHEQWDLRFSLITYLPKQDNEVQLFSYKTKIGFGIEINGWGKSVGSFHGEDGSRTSALHFGTDQAISIIREGKGYWKYKPSGDTITFLTQYDYEPQFGHVGQWFDHFIFRPLIGWGTALSFDVLKRWLEQEEPPSSQYLRFFSHWLISLLFAFIWIYHGLVPKLMNMHPEEVDMVRRSLSVDSSQAALLVIVIGVGEVLFGLVWLFYRNKRQLFRLQILLFPLLTLSALLSHSNYFVQPFNPLTFNASLFVVTIVGFIMSKDVPTAANCKRKR